jgi:integrase
VEFLPRESEERLPFDEEQVKALLVATEANGDEEWRRMILFGYHAGLRLTDCAELSCDNIDFAGRTLTFRAKKTAKRNGNKETTIALHQDVVTYLDSLLTGSLGCSLFTSQTNRDSIGSFLKALSP